MNNRVKFLVCLLVVYASGCTEKPLTPAELYEKYNGAVVLIKHVYYYEAIYDNGFKMYFSNREGGSGDDFYFYHDKSNALSDPDVSFGTGFFVDGFGCIATNRHVVSPQYDKRKLAKMNDDMTSMKINITSDINRYAYLLQNLREYYNANYTEFSFEARHFIGEKIKMYTDSLGIVKMLGEEFDFSSIEPEISLRTINLGVAYNNSMIDPVNGFSECNVIYKSEDSNVDLAFIRLGEEVTPFGITYFDLNKQKEGKTKLNDIAYMIGFNYGYELAKTTKGIKSQLTQGNISQEPDDYRMLYTIPALSGSSGSPVINERGNIVAVNYAGLRNEQNFNFGIPVQRLINMYNKAVRYNYNLSDELGTDNGETKGSGNISH